MIDLQPDRHAAPAPSNSDPVFRVTDFGQVVLERGRKGDREGERGGGN